MPSSRKRRRPIRKKLVIIGDSRCGKTSLFNAYVFGRFPYDQWWTPSPTIFYSWIEELTLDGNQVELELWDTASHGDHDRLRPLSYLRAHVILIAFCINSPESLLYILTTLYPEVQAHCNPDIPVLLVGCKADLRVYHSSSAVPSCLISHADAVAVADTIGAQGYYECSALTIEGVVDVFEDAVRASMDVGTPSQVEKCTRCVIC